MKSKENIKKCNLCPFEGDESLFVKNKNRCKKCHSKISLEYLQNNKEKAKKYNKKSKEKNKNKIKKQRKLYRKNNINKIREYDRKYSKERKKRDPSFRLRKILSTSISEILKNNNGSKNGQSILKYLSYSSKELIDYLESLFEPWMSWENYGVYKSNTWNDNDPSTWKWQLDHIIPHSDLPYDSMFHPNFQKAWALSNLRPYSAKQNTIDGATKIRHKNNKRNRK